MISLLKQAHHYGHNGGLAGLIEANVDILAKHFVKALTILQRIERQDHYCIPEYFPKLLR